MKRIIFSLILLMFLVGCVDKDIDIDINMGGYDERVIFTRNSDLFIFSPAKYSEYTTTSVITSVLFNQSKNSETHWNLSIYHTNTKRGIPRILYSYTINNNSIQNKIFEFKDNKRHWIVFKIENITNVSIASGVIVFDVDTSWRGGLN